MHHAAWPLSIGRNRRDRNRDALTRIANTLGVSAATLAEWAPSESYPDETAELIRLWFKIPDDGARRTVLEALRRVAGEGEEKPASV